MHFSHFPHLHGPGHGHGPENHHPAGYSAPSPHCAPPRSKRKGWKAKNNEHVRWRKVIITAATLFTTIAIVFASVFYIPAFSSNSKILSISTHHVKTPQQYEVKRPRYFFLSYVNMFKQRRSYLRPGHLIRVRYNVPSGAELYTVIRRCDKPIVIEALFCGADEPVVFSEKVYGSGEVTFQSLVPGFYIYDDLLLEEGQRSEKPYIAMWERE